MIQKDNQKKHYDQTSGAALGQNHRNASRGPTEEHSIASLHKAVGNNAVQELITNSDYGFPIDISHPRDEDEREANRVAATVAFGTRNSTELSYHLNQTTEMGRGVSTNDPKPSSFHVVKPAWLGNQSGRPLSVRARSLFEPQFGQTFDDVRIHDGPKAAELATSLDAAAFTLGRDIYFGSGRFQPNSLPGQRLLAHELTHVVQKRESGSMYRSQPRIQREPEDQKQETEGQRQSWLPELDEILPGRVGLVTHIERVQTLLEIFGASQLEDHVRLIHSNASATRFTKRSGVPGIVALYDTRRGNALDVQAAHRALDQHSQRYQRGSLRNLRLKPPTEIQPAYWFRSPGSQRADTTESGQPETGQSRRARVHIEQQLSSVGNIHVRFAYPESEISTSGLSSGVRNAKQSILQALAQLISDIGSLPPASSREERREQETTRARLREAISGFGTSSPLNIFIETDPTQELFSGQVSAFTDQIYVDIDEVGNQAKLQAAIRMPLLMIEGGPLPTRSGVKQIPAASQNDLQRTLLHESLHVLLVRRSNDANAIWEANKSRLNIQGSPNAKAKFIELVRKYLIAQEEIFAYENETSLYPSAPGEKSTYETYISNVEQFLRRQQSLSLNNVKRSIPVSQQVAGQEVQWEISYLVPKGTINLSVGDIQVVNLLLGIYPR